MDTVVSGRIRGAAPSILTRKGVVALDRRDRRPADPRVSVVVPARDEAANIREVLPYLAGFHEVIVVVRAHDHPSAQAARAVLPSAKVVHQTRNGKGNALVCGFHQVTGDVIVTFDVDGSADPHEIPDFIAALTGGADLAKGSRFCPGGGSQKITPLRGAGNAGLNLVARSITKTRFTDLCYGFNAFWADQLPRLDLPDTDPSLGPQVGDGFEIEAMIIGRFALCGAVITEVPSYEHHCYHGETNLKATRDGLRALRTLLTDRLHARRTHSWLGAAFGRRSAAGTGRRPSWMLDHPVVTELDAASGPDLPDQIDRTLEGVWIVHDDVPDVIRAGVSIAATEVANNIVEHASCGSPVRVRMEVRVFAHQVRIEFIDEGAPPRWTSPRVACPTRWPSAGAGLRWRVRSSANCRIAGRTAATGGPSSARASADGHGIMTAARSGRRTT